MAKIYKNEKQRTSVVTGRVESISPDRLSMTVATTIYDKAAKVNNEISVKANTAIALGDDVAVGKSIAFCGYDVPDMTDPSKIQYQVMSVLTNNQVFEYGTLAVVSGDVVFASYNEELDETGKPKMSKPYTKEDGTTVPPHAKKPHFDISINVFEPEDGSDKDKRILHTIKIYPDPVKGADGKVAEGKFNLDKIERFKKMFANFDRKDNPIKMTIVTQPGAESCYTKTVGDKEYINFTSSHMGAKSWDIEYTKDRTKTAEPATRESASPAPTVSQAAPATPAPEPEPAQPTIEEDEMPFF